MSIFDIFRTIRLRAGQQYHNVKKTFVTTLNATTGYSGFIPEQLVIAPQDLRSADSIIPTHFEHGQFTLASHVEQIKVGENPFTAKTENTSWLESLHNFRWLRHFKEEKFANKKNLAQSLVSQWINLNENAASTLPWQVGISAQRLIAWLCHSVTILKKADAQFHEDFMRSIGIHIRYLHRYSATEANPLDRLMAHLALVYAALCRADIPSDLKTIESRLLKELASQIHPDGGHIDRNPETTLLILSYVLPLKQTYLSRELESPENLDEVISKLFLALKFFRIGNGGLTRFNGNGVMEFGLLTSVLRYQDSDQSVLSLPHSGYERLQQDTSTLIMDCGIAPEGILSETCHAGNLAIEFSSGQELIFVNSGLPVNTSAYKESSWRKTASHSTAVMNKISSSKFIPSRGGKNPYLGQLLSNRNAIETIRTDTKESQSITAAHLGYEREFGARHERRVELTRNGKKLSGVEWFSSPDKSDLRYSMNDAVNVHFHLHPDCTANIWDEGKQCVITLRSGKKWRFSAQGFTLSLEDSTYFANHSGPRKSIQIVVSAKVSDTPEIGWALEEIQ